MGEVRAGRYGQCFLCWAASFVSGNHITSRFTEDNRISFAVGLPIQCDGIQSMYNEFLVLPRAYFESIGKIFRKFNILQDRNLKYPSIGTAFTLGFHKEWP